jgi:hypothetical protein
MQPILHRCKVAFHTETEEIPSQCPEQLHTMVIGRTGPDGRDYFTGKSPIEPLETRWDTRKRHGQTDEVDHENGSHGQVNQPLV